MSKTWLNYHHLYYFATIALEGSIAKAAAKLRLGQSTLSTQLKQFEDVTGIQLFERHHKKLILTEAGKLALEYAKEIFRMGDEMLEVLNDRLVPSRIHVQIGAIDSIPKHLIAMLTQTALSIGNCTISVLEGKGDELLRELLAHKLDLVLTNYAPTAHSEKGIQSRSVGRFPVVVCGAPRFKSLAKDFPRSLDRQPFVLPTHDSKLRHDVEQFFAQEGISLDRVAETQDTGTQKLLGMDGMGLTVTSLIAVAEHIKSGEFVQLGTLPGVTEEVYLVAASRKIANPISSRLFRQFQCKAQPAKLPPKRSKSSS